MTQKIITQGTTLSNNSDSNNKLMIPLKKTESTRHVSLISPQRQVSFAYHEEVMFVRKQS